MANLKPLTYVITGVCIYVTMFIIGSLKQVKESKFLPARFFAWVRKTPVPLFFPLIWNVMIEVELFKSFGAMGNLTMESNELMMQQF